jgi:hypothetical protein
VFDSLRTLQQEGKVKQFGASVESMEEALICPATGRIGIAANHFQYLPPKTH